MSASYARDVTGKRGERSPSRSDVVLADDKEDERMKHFPSTLIRGIRSTSWDRYQCTQQRPRAMDRILGSEYGSTSMPAIFLFAEIVSPPRHNPQVVHLLQLCVHFYTSSCLRTARKDASTSTFSGQLLLSPRDSY